MIPVDVNKKFKVVRLKKCDLLEFILMPRLNRKSLKNYFRFELKNIYTYSYI